MFKPLTLIRNPKHVNLWRYSILMMLGVCLNTGLHEFASAFDLPMWLDSAGTALCALALEPAAGLLVALANNFILAIELNSPHLILYYAVGAAIALIVGLTLRKNGKISIRRIPVTMLLLLVICSTMSTALTFWLSGGVSNNYWERYFYLWYESHGLPYWLGLFMSIATVKFFDIIASAAFLGLLYLVLPKWLMQPQMNEPK